MTGRILGWLIVTGYSLTVLNYLLKAINRRWVMPLPKESAGRARYQAFMRPFIRYHRYFAFLTAAALITHFIIQYLSWGFYITGLLAGTLMVLQVFLGVYGTYWARNKRGSWLYVHRTTAVLLLAAMAIHILYVSLSRQGLLF